MAHPGGRPLKFPTVEILQEKIDAYFRDTPDNELTWTGLALALDTSRETLQNYQERDQFFDVIKKANERVQHSYEMDLRRKGRSGDIFVLKNFGWKDQQNIDHTTAGQPMFLPSELLIKNAINSSPKPDSA